MELKSMTLFQAVKKRMDWLAQRQEVLSQNIANADTPKYRARDLKSYNFIELIRRENTQLNMKVGSDILRLLQVVVMLKAQVAIEASQRNALPALRADDLDLSHDSKYNHDSPISGTITIATPIITSTDAIFTP